MNVTSGLTLLECQSLARFMWLQDLHWVCVNGKASLSQKQKLWGSMWATHVACVLKHINELISFNVISFS